MRFFIKKILFPSLLFIAFYVQGQHYNVFMINVAPVFDETDKTFLFSFERSVAKSFSAGLSFEAGKYDLGSIDDVPVYDLKGWGIMLQLRYYPFSKNKPAPFGFFIGTHIRFRSVREHYYDNGYDISTKGASFDWGGHIGYKAKMGPLNFEFLFGCGGGTGKYHYPNSRDLIDQRFTNDLHSFDDFLRMEISVGFHFPQFYK